MATTTNYGWTTPDDTSLVKDGASAIRSLGTSIDTTTKNLNPQTTTGAIAYRSSTSNVNTSLPIGTAGQVLTVNSGATAPEWAAPATGGMTLISTTTLNGTPTTLLSSIPQTYNTLYIVIQNYKPTNDSGYLSLRFNNDNTANRHRTIESTTAGDSTLTFNSTQIIVMSANDNSVANGLCVIEIPNYTNATTWKLCRVYSIATDPATTTSFRSFNAVGHYNQTGAISSLGFLSSDGGNSTSGSLLLYGVK